MHKIGLEVARGKTVETSRRGAGLDRGDRAAGRGAAELHDGRQRFVDRLQPQRVRRPGPPRTRPVAHHAGADRGIDPRLERVRNGGDARQGRQRRDHLLDRELRPDGDPHRRFDHGGPDADLERQGIPADARRLAGRDPRDRRRDGRVEHPVCDPSGDGSDDRHRDESAREPLQCAGVEGDRLSDRQDRGQAGRRLSAARTAERHHPRDDRLLRADDRLRGDQGPAVRVREIPRGRSRRSPRR